jgi:hypothetical protein
MKRNMPNGMGYRVFRYDLASSHLPGPAILTALEVSPWIPKYIVRNWSVPFISVAS